MTDRDDLWPAFRQAWVIYEDDALLVVDKPAGIPVHGSELAGEDLKARLQAWLTQRDGRLRPLWLLHGLDREASGLVLVSKDKAVNGELAAQLQAGVTRRFVMATAAAPRASRSVPPRNRRTRGRPRHDTAQRPGRQRGQAPAQSMAAAAYETLAESAPRRLLAVAANHSGGGLRQQFAAAGAPIAGDRDAGGPAATRLMLHHERMRLRHPKERQWLALQATVPTAFQRWLDHGAEQALPSDADELRSALAEAIERRYPLSLDGASDAFRLVHGAGDGLPGVELDRYGDYLVLRLHEEVAEPLRAQLIEAVGELGFAGLYLKVRPQHASVIVDARQASWAPSMPVVGEAAAEPLAVSEHGVSYLAQLGDGLSTGLFLDQRDNRQRVRQLSGGKRVLNLFGYHAAFTVAAVVGGAASSVTVDSSRAAIARAGHNLAQFSAGPPQHVLVCADALTWLEQALEQGQRFDLIVLDPPSYATTKTSRFSAKRDYIELAARALRLIEPGGALLACTNLRQLDDATFERWLRLALERAGRRWLRLERLPCPVDHPPHPSQGSHLKSTLLRLSA